MKYQLRWIIFVLIFVSTSLAMDTIKDKTIDLISDASVPTVPTEEMGAQQMVMDKYYAWLNDGFGAKLKSRENEIGFYLGYGIADVSVGPENDQWAKFRVMAYERAYVQAMSNYLKFCFQTTGTETVYSLFADQNMEKPEYQPDEFDILDNDKLTEIVSKLLALGDAQLSKALEELNVDPAEFEKVPEPQKKILLTESLVKTTMTKSGGRLSGVVPVKTFEGVDQKNNHAILVVIVASDNLRQFAYEIQNRRGQLEKSDQKRESLYKQVTEGGVNSLVDAFGVRKLFDETGYPCLVSFGQWSLGKDVPSGRIAEKKRSIAVKQAEALADASITDYLSSQGNYLSESSIGEAFEEAWKVHHDNFAELIEKAQIVDIFSETFVRKGKANISGLSTLYSWTMKHPKNDHTIVGVVRVWTPVQEQSAVGSKTWKPDRQTSSNSKKSQSEAGGEAEIRESKDYNEVNDF